MCEFCQNKKPLFKSKHTEVFLCKSGSTGKPSIDITQGGYHLVLEIEFCPKCNNKLSEVL